MRWTCLGVTIGDTAEAKIEADTTWTLPLQPLEDHKKALRCAFQSDAIEAAKDKKRLRDVERHLQVTAQSRVRLEGYSCFGTDVHQICGC